MTANDSPPGRSAINPSFGRRRMLAGLAGAGVTTLVGTSPLLGGMQVLAAPGAGRTVNGRDTVLVNVFLRGGADGLNIVVPHGDDDYRRLRPGIGIPRSQLTDLDGFFGLHPAFAPLYPLYESGRFAVVHAAGSTDPSRSHFAAQDNMDLAFGQTGWMQRALAAAGAGDPLTAVSIADRTAPSLRGPSGGIAVRRIDQFKRMAAELDDSRATLEAMYDAALVSGDTLTGSATGQAFAAVDQMDDIRVDYQAPYPANFLGGQLRQASAFIKADLGVRMIAVSLGGWDHHTNTEPQMNRKGDQLATALAAFADDLGDDAARVVTVVMSEFGRTVAENGGAGTDHGHGNVMMVMGDALAAGGGGRVHLADDSWVGLSPADLVDGRDLAITTDFRSVLAELLDHHLGMDAGLADGSVFPGFDPTPVGLLGDTTTGPGPVRPLPIVSPGRVTGRVRYVDGTPAAGVKVDLFTGESNRRVDFLGSTRTGADGVYDFVALPGPHILTFIAPEGQTFVPDRRYHQVSFVIEEAGETTGLDATLSNP
jgi:uncharacterized protein (DUF1501 family)